MSVPKFGRVLRASVAIAAIRAGVAPAAHAQAPGPGGDPNLIGFEVKAVDAANRQATGVMHCVPPDQAGRIATFHVDDAVDIAQLQPGAVTGVELGPGAGAPQIVGLAQAPCQFQPGAPGPQGPQGGPGGPGAPGQGGPGGKPDLTRGFLNRVWKFEGEADGFEDGVLSMTLSKVLNLPKAMANQDDSLVDEDTLVLVGSQTRVYDVRKLVKERKEASELAAAESVRVQGKMLPPAKWHKDEDGDDVPTIRAKKIYILD